MTKKFRKKSARILLAAELIFALAVVIAAVRWRQEGDSVVYSLDYSSLDAGKGVSMETFPYSEFSGIYLDNSLMDDGEKELTVKTSTTGRRNSPSKLLRSRWCQVSTGWMSYIPPETAAIFCQYSQGSDGFRRRIRLILLCRRERIGQNP